MKALRERYGWLPAGVWLVGFLLICTHRAAAESPQLDFAAVERVAAEEMKTGNTPGAAVAVVRGGEVIWAKGLGVANMETGQAVTPEMLFRLGSTTKMFTAAALVGLAEEGKLKLDEPIGKSIPGLHPRIAGLTAHQLLTHTAGLTDESIMSGSHDDSALGVNVRKIDETWLFTEPGKIHSYSNPGYWIAGLACEAVSDKPYADVLEERLFRPLGMERTTLRPTLAMTWPLALGHEVRNGKPSIVRPQADNAGTWPAGQIYSSVLELARFTTAFMDQGKLDGKEVLKPAVIEKLQAPHVARPGTSGHYGYGLSISTEQGIRIVQHGGSRTGYGSTIRMAPEKHVAVTVLTNRSGSSLPKTANKAMEIALGVALLAEEDDEPRGKLAVFSESEMAELVGVYTNNRQSIGLSLSEGKLVAQRLGGESRLGGSVMKSGEKRISVTSESGRSLSSFTVVRDAAGKSEYLLSGSRALKKQP